MLLVWRTTVSLLHFVFSFGGRQFGPLAVDEELLRLFVENLRKRYRKFDFFVILDYLGIFRDLK